MSEFILNTLNKKRDRKLTDLYQILTHSDLQGHMESDRIVVTLYALYCIDAVNRQEMPLNEEEYLILARELVRIDETQLFDYDYSMKTWARGLLEYMSDNDLSVVDIHRMNSIDLKKEVYQYIKP